MYARSVEQNDSTETLTFGVSGKLIMNVLVMFDRQTNTLWSQMLGEAVQGPLQGAELQPVASLQTTWQQWKELHPETKALVTNGKGATDPYAEYYRNDFAGASDEARQDLRLPRKALVTGVVVAGQAVAYDRTTLRQVELVNDTINGVPILVLFAPETATSLVFERSIDSHTLTFRQGNERLELIDNETGSTWLLLTGTATSGEFKGSTLTRVPSTSAFWFGWKDWHPETLVYRRGKE